MDPLRELLLPKLDGIRRSGSGYTAKCPAHDDGRASLSVGPGKDQPVLIHCFAGCDRDAVLDAIGLSWADLCKPRDDQPGAVEEWTPCGPAVAVYDYVDEQGDLLFQVCRTADKQFPQRRRDPSKKSGWAWKLGDVRRVLYRLPRLLEAMDAGTRVWIVEGEKDVHALERAGEVATCCPGGAGKWRDEFGDCFVAMDVTIVADRDEPGQKHARTVAQNLEGTARSVRIVEAKSGKDAADHLAAGHGVDEFEVTWRDQTAAKPDLAPDLWEFLAVADEARDWVIPGLLERGDRLVWTGFEGLGKSMFIRQLAVTAAAGLHPFEFDNIPPQRVLLVDCENSERQSRRKFRPLGAASVQVGRRVPDGALRLIHRPAGIDLTRPDDRAWLLERVMAHQPDLLMIGPFYRLHAANINEETAARATVAALDAARTAVDCALVVEAHAGHGEHGAKRSVRPLGSSLLLRWPEFGYGIAPDGEPVEGKNIRVKVLPWRGDRDERNWPRELEWGNPWPWVPAVPQDVRELQERLAQEEHWTERGEAS